jgi:hypothetical protein
MLYEIYSLFFYLWRQCFRDSRRTELVDSHFYLNKEYLNEEYVLDGEILVHDYYWVGEHPHWFGHRKVVQYGMEQVQLENPNIHKQPTTPWVWIGIKETEEDLTETLNDYVVVGNVLKPELLNRFLQNPEHTIQYIDSRSFDMIPIPENGIRIL